MNAENNSINNENKHRYSIIITITLIVFLLFIILSISSTASSSEVVVDSINIGDPLDEADHSLFGFGPIEPATHGGSWGGADDGTLRVVWYNDSSNPSDISTDSPDENYASLVLNTQNNYIANKIKIRALDGIADDSFEIYIEDFLVYSYGDVESSETWKTHEIDISSFEISDQIQLKIVSTGTKWSNFDTYGQLSISWIELCALEARQVTVRLVDSFNNSLKNGIVEYYKNGWKEFGTTDVNGNTTKLIPKAKYTFRMKYLDAAISKRQDISNNPLVVFSTVPVTVRFENSSGVEISGGNVSFHSGGWKFFGVTDTEGEAIKELLPRKYTFRLKHDGASISKRQDISSDPLVVFSTIKVTVLFQDSKANPISSSEVSYHSSGWKYLGVTDNSGRVYGEFLARKYTFKISYQDSSLSKRQDISNDPLVVFSTIEVSVLFEDSNQNPISGGNVSFHSGGWKFFGITDLNGEATNELLSRKYTFRLKHDGASISKRQDVSIDPNVIFNTINVTVKLQKSNGSSLSGGVIYYHSSGWKYIGITDQNGSTYKELLPRKYTFKVNYDGASNSLRQDVGSNPLVVFSTVPVTVRFENSSGIEISGGNVSYHSGGWKFFGFTDNSGEASKELLPRKYTFGLKYDGASISKRQDISSDPLVVFSTTKVTLKLQNSSGNSISGGNVSYHSSGWKYLGITDNSGCVSGEFLPRKFTFRMKYLDAAISKRQDISSNPLVVFSTVPVTVRFENSSGVTVSGGNVSFHSGGWKFFGLTDSDGEAIKELLPRKYTFRLKHDGASISKRQDISSDPLVVFSTIEVTVILIDEYGTPLSYGNLSYHSSGWKVFGITDSNGQAKNELLPRKYTFKAVYNKSRYIKRQNVGEDSFVTIKTDIIDNYPPVSDANGPYLGYVDEIITFNASKSYDSDGSISNYTWNFGDGNIGYGISVEHIYSNVGDYIVNLTITDNNGLVDYNLTYSRIAEEEKAPLGNGKTHSGSNNYVPSNLIPNEDEGEESIDPDETEDEEVSDQPTQEKVNNPPIAKASINKEKSDENSIIFDASESYDPDGDILFYRWDFDNDGSWDTSYSNEPKVTYQYKDTSFEGKAIVQVFDGKNTVEISVSYSIEKNIQNCGKASSQESSDKGYYLFVEWWVFFIPILLFFLLTIYIYKKRFIITKKLDLVNLISIKKQKRLCKIITTIFEYF